MDLNKLSPQALKAAIVGGTDGWGQHGSIKGARYAEPVCSKSRRRCKCGCKRRATHRGMNNGISLITACELQVMRWVRDPATAFSVRKRPSPPPHQRAE